MQKYSISIFAVGSSAVVQLNNMRIITKLNSAINSKLRPGDEEGDGGDSD